jgi:hypothetical protein
VGVSYVVNGRVESLLFDPENPMYSINVLVLDEDGTFLRLLHIFVGRYLKHIKFRGPFEVWRWHYDAWPVTEAPPPRYARPVEYQRDDDGGCMRHSFEHLDGQNIVDPYMLTMELAGQSTPIATCDKNLVPERESYRCNPPVLSFPGMQSEELGILGYYEDLLEQDRPRPRLWVN